MDHGSIEIKFEAIIVRDIQNRWEYNPIAKFLRGLYERYIIRTRLDEYEIKLFEEISEMIKQTKSFLAIEAQS